MDKNPYPLNQNITVAPRPYVVTMQGFTHESAEFPLTTSEVKRLVMAFPVVSGDANRLTLLGVCDTLLHIRPATLSGGPAFTYQ